MNKTLIAATALFFTVLFTNAPHQPLKNSVQDTLSYSTDCLAPQLKTNRQAESMELLKRFCTILKDKKQISNTPDLTQMVTSELMGWLDLIEHLQIIYANDHDKVLEILTKAITDQYALFTSYIDDEPGAQVLPFVTRNFPMFEKSGKTLDFFNSRQPIDRLDFFDTGKDFKSIAVTSDNVLTDGLGDVAHVLAMAKSLKERFPGKEINIYLPEPVNTSNRPGSTLARWQQKYMKFLKNSGVFENIKWFKNSEDPRFMLKASIGGVQKSGIGEDLIVTVPCPQQTISKEYIPESTKLVLSVSEYQPSDSHYFRKQFYTRNEGMLISLRYTSGIVPNIGLHFPNHVIQQAKLLKADINTLGYEHVKQTSLQTLWFASQLVQYQQSLNLSQPQMLLADIFVKSITQRALTCPQHSRWNSTRTYLNQITKANGNLEVINTARQQLPKLQESQSALNLNNVLNRLLGKSSNPEFSESLEQELALLAQINDKALNLLDNMPEIQLATSIPWAFAYCTHANSVRMFIDEMAGTQNTDTPALLFNLSPPLSYHLQNNFAITDTQNTADGKLENGVNVLNLQTMPHYFFVELMLLSNDIMTTGDQSTVEALISSAVMENKILNFEARIHKQDFVIDLLQHLGQAGYVTTKKSDMAFTFPYGNFSASQIRQMRIETSQKIKTLMENANMVDNLTAIIDKAWKESNRLNYMREIFESFSQSA